ncbi:MAG: DUF2752 domain-containing protein [Muribaculaceae bacterium]|nr:DUF2752 domain-containing protein [Muribaculaceae bacterium]MDE6461514.1 DUF2752 domain-containing protein [Muribaculaceae bacterium]
MRIRKAMLILPVAAIVAVGVISVIDPTGDYGHFFPKCPFMNFTGYACPGCGTSRAIHALCSWRFADALSYNYFLPPVILLLLSAIIVEMWPTRFHLLRHVVLSRAVLYCFLALTIAWWIIRNIFGI